MNEIEEIKDIKIPIIHIQKAAILAAGIANKVYITQNVNLYHWKQAIELFVDPHLSVIEILFILFTTVSVIPNKKP